MTLHRSSLLLLAIAALLISGTPISAGSGDSAAVAWLDAGRFIESASPAADPVLSSEAAIPPSDFILCTCKFCRENPEVICQISPTGYSILCEDYSRTHC